MLEVCGAAANAGVQIVAPTADISVAEGRRLLEVDLSIAS